MRTCWMPDRARGGLRVVLRQSKTSGAASSFGPPSPPSRSAGTITIAMDSWISWIVGGITLANAVFNGYAMCVHPAFKKGGRFHAHADPFKGMSTGEQEVAAYLRKNPDVAVRVGSTAAKVAASNPDLARDAMRGAASASTPAGGSSSHSAGKASGAASPSPFSGSAGHDDENPFS